ncbi:hypothetical protein GRR94_04085 [Vibrio cholerae]|nr:hypothetical protein [Vibrio cholerae]
MKIKMAEIFGSEGMKNLHLRGALVLTGPEAQAAVLAVKNHDRLTQENQQLREALSGLLDIVGDSQGVAGYHLNGAIAEWSYFDEVNEAKQLLFKLEAKDD